MCYGLTDEIIELEERLEQAEEVLQEACELLDASGDRGWNESTGSFGKTVKRFLKKHYKISKGEKRGKIA